MKKILDYLALFIVGSIACVFLTITVLALIINWKILVFFLCCLIVVWSFFRANDLLS